MASIFVIHTIFMIWLNKFNNTMRKRKEVTSFTIGCISRRNLRANSCSTNEDSESQPTGDKASIILLDRLLLSPANLLVWLDVCNLALRWWWSACGGQCMVVQEACGGGHASYSSLTLYSFPSFTLRKLFFSCVFVLCIKLTEKWMWEVLEFWYVKGIGILDDEWGLDYGFCDKVLEALIGAMWLEYSLLCPCRISLWIYLWEWMTGLLEGLTWHTHSKKWPYLRSDKLVPGSKKVRRWLCITE